MSASVNDEEFRALLERLLAPIRQSRHTPLQFEIDSTRIVDAALTEFPGGNTADRGAVATGLDQLVALTLGDGNEAVAASKEARSPAREEPATRGGSDPLVSWFDHFFNHLREVDQRAIDILALKIEGYSERDIAEKLTTGLRLIERVSKEMRPEQP